MRLQQVLERHRPRLPLLLLRRQLVHRVLQLLGVHQLALPAPPCGERVLPSLPLYFLLLRCVGSWWLFG